MTESSNISATPTQVTINPVGDSVYVTGYYTNTDTADYSKGTITVGDQQGEAVTLVPLRATAWAPGPRASPVQLEPCTRFAVEFLECPGGTLDDA